MVNRDGPLEGQMGPCALCSSDRPAGRVIPVITAVRQATTRKTGFKEYTTTTTTGLVEEHQRKVCVECVAGERRSRWVLVAVVALVFAIGIPVLMAAEVAGGWVAAVAFAVLVGAFWVDQTFIDLQQRAKRATIGTPAISLFRTSAPGPEVIGFTADEYKSFVRKNR